MIRNLLTVMALSILTSITANAADSTCFGSVNNGHLENGLQLPAKGKNFIAYSSLGSFLGRTYVHSKVSEVMLRAYAALEVSAPSKTFVYGETGWASGGRFRPHRSHKNGLSVDFFVPVIDAKGNSVSLPTGVRNKFGYSIDFDEHGRYDGYAIDFEAIGEHLYQLDVAAKAHGVGIALAIFDPPYLAKLFQTKRGKYVKANINFMKGNAWVRHDEHYHIDFLVACKANERRAS